MSSNNLAPFFALPLDQSRRSSFLNEIDVSLMPQPFVKKHKILPPISREKSPRLEPKFSPETGIKVTLLSRSGERALIMPVKMPGLKVVGAHRGKNFADSFTPPLHGNLKARVTRYGSVGNIPNKTWSPMQKQSGHLDGVDAVAVLSNSEGAKQLASEKKRIRTLRSRLMRKLSFHSSGTGGLLSPDRIIRRGSDAVFSVLSMESVTSPGIGSTMRLCDATSRTTSESTAFSESRVASEGFIPLRRRKSSNALLVPDFDLEVVSSRRTSLCRRSSVTSISFPDVMRNARLTQNSRPHAIQEPHFFKVKQPRSRRASSNSDEYGEGKVGEAMSRNSVSPFAAEAASAKLPYLGTSQLHRRVKAGSVPQQFIREMRGRRRRRRKSINFTDQPIEKFRKVARSVRLLLKCLTNYRMIATVSDKGEMPFAMFSTNLTSVRRYPGGLKFDPGDYKATHERQVSAELRRILTLSPSLRTEKELNFALKSLRVLADAFGEFPIRMQESLVKVTWLDEFEAKRVIIRQGQPAENFYFIVTGSVLVSKNRIDPRTGELFVQTVRILRRGMSFGELAIMRRETRSANVISNSALSLLTVSRKDFIEIFMHRMDGEEPEFISFLRKLPEFALFPLQQIPRNKPQLCAFTYFRVGVVISDESSANDAIVVVKSGACRVLKAMKAVKADLNALKSEKFVFVSSLLTGERKVVMDGSDDHRREIIGDYNDWTASHPLSLNSLKLLGDDEETFKREGRRLPSLIEVERNIDYDKVSKEVEIFTNSLDEETEVEQAKEDLVHIHVQTLGEGDVFGLAPLLFEPSEGGVHMSLVSEGAECILLNKNFYLKNMDAEIRERLIRTIRPFPTVETLEENMKHERNWDAFKNKTMKDYLSNRKACRGLKHNGHQRYR